MADPTRPASDLHNQPADQKLINEHPEKLDPSLRGQVPGPQPAAAPAPAAPQAPAPTASDAGQPSTAPSAPSDSKGLPRPHGQGGSDEEKTGYANARRQEQVQRGERVTPPGEPATDQAGKKR